MKTIRRIGYVMLVVAAAAAIAGCNCEEKKCCGTCGGDKKAAEKTACCGTCGGDKKAAAEEHPAKEHPASEKPAGEKPLDHPAH